jgi:spermidine/putrescine transport system substrate-binding protein
VNNGITRRIGLLAATALVFAACGGGAASSAPSAAAPSVAASVAPASAAATEAPASAAATEAPKSEGELNVLAWAGEVPDSTVAAFEKATGVKVTLDTFDSNESMIAKLAGGATGYDVVEPSQYAVQIAAKQGLIVELDQARLPSIGNLGKAFRENSYDTGNKYSLPYIWGTTGFAYNDQCVTTAPTSWKVLFEDTYKGKMYMLDNMLAAYIAGLQVNGFGANSTDPAEIEKATQTLIDQRPLLAGYNSTNFADLLGSGDACVAEAWSGSVAQVASTNAHVHFVLPDEGGTMWVDGYSIVKDAPHPNAAYQWLEYNLQPDVAANVVKEGGTASAVEAANSLIDPAILGNSAIYPSADKLQNADFILDTGDATKLYQDGWTKVKAGG